MEILRREERFEMTGVPMLYTFEVALLQRTPARILLDKFSFKLDVLLKHKDLVDSPYLSSVIKEFLMRDSTYERDDQIMELYVEALSKPLNSFNQHFIVNGHMLSIQSSNVYVECGTTAKRIWEASLALINFLTDNDDILKGKKILELGSGTGFAGLATKCIGAASATLTDLPDVLETVTKPNYEKCAFCDAVSLKVLDWSDSKYFPFDEYDVFLGADLIYDPDISSYLADSLNFIYNRNPSAKIYLMQFVRNETTFNDFMEKVSFLEYSSYNPQKRRFLFDGEFRILHNK